MSAPPPPIFCKATPAPLHVAAKPAGSEILSAPPSPVCRRRFKSAWKG